MKPLQHARITAHRYGGEWQDWIASHDWIDRSKAIFPSIMIKTTAWQTSLGAYHGL